MNKLVVLIFFALTVSLSFAADDSLPAGLKSLIMHTKSAHDRTMTSLVLTDEEAQKLIQAYPALKKLSRNEGLKEEFWPCITGNLPWESPKEVTWPKAKEMIMKGHVRSITQYHRGSLNIVFTTTSYETYKAPLEKIDQAYHLLKEIDPKGVFVDYSSE